MQGYFIIPVAIFVSISSILVLVLPVAQEPIPALIAISTTLLGVPAYIFFVMETPWRLKPRIFTKISSKPPKSVYIHVHVYINYRIGTEQQHMHVRLRVPEPGIMGITSCIMILTF